MRHILTVILSLFCIVCAKAQEGLEVSHLFNGEGKWRLKFTASHISGRALKPYNLTLFRSITTGDSRLYNEIEKIVNKDAQKTIDKECGYIDGRLYYGFFLFEPKDKKYRYLFYRNSSLRSNEPEEATIVYMEGYELTLWCDCSFLVNCLP